METNTLYDGSPRYDEEPFVHEEPTELQFVKMRGLKFKTPPVYLYIQEYSGKGGTSSCKRTNGDYCQ